MTPPDHSGHFVYTDGYQMEWSGLWIFVDMSRRPYDLLAKRYHPRRHPAEIMEWVCHPGYRNGRAKALLRQGTDSQGQMTGTSGISNDIASQGLDGDVAKRIRSGW